MLTRGNLVGPKSAATVGQRTSVAHAAHGSAPLGAWPSCRTSRQERRLSGDRETWRLVVAYVAPLRSIPAASRHAPDMVLRACTPSASSTTVAVTNRGALMIPWRVRTRSRLVRPSPEDRAGRSPQGMRGLCGRSAASSSRTSNQFSPAIKREVRAAVRGGNPELKRGFAARAGRVALGGCVASAPQRTVKATFHRPRARFTYGFASLSAQLISANAW